MMFGEVLRGGNCFGKGGVLDCCKDEWIEEGGNR